MNATCGIPPLDHNDSEEDDNNHDDNQDIDIRKNQQIRTWCTRIHEI
jgi:hypothetical protein